MLKKAPKIITIILSLVFIIFLVLVGYYYYIYKKSPFSKNEGLDRVLAIVDDEKIIQKDLNEKIFLKYKTGTPENPEVNVSDEEKKELLGQLIEAKIINKEAHKRNISASEEEINNKLELFSSYKEKKEIWNLLWEDAKITVLKEKIKDQVLGWREGKYLFARFDRNLPGEANPNVDKNKYNQDKEYARNFIEVIYNDLKNNKITFDQAINKTLADNYLGESVYHTFIAGFFTKEEFLEKTGVLQNEQIYKKVMETAEGQISNIEVGKVLTLEGEKEGFYFIVKVEKIGGNEALSWEEWLSGKKKEYNVKVYADYAKDLVKENVVLAVSSNECEKYEYLGVNTGLANDWAGLVIRTYVLWSSSSMERINIDNIKIQNTNGTDGIARLGEIRCGEDGCYVVQSSIRRFGERTFSSGSGYYCGSCRDNCAPSTSHSQTGYLVLGKGYDNLKQGSSSGFRSYGNRYVLDCTNDANGKPYMFKIVLPSTSTITKNGINYLLTPKYMTKNGNTDNKYSFTFNYNSYNSSEFNVSNGATLYIDVFYNPNTAPIPVNNGIKVGENMFWANNSEIIANFDGKATIQLVGYATDREGDNVRIRFRYRKVDENNKPLTDNWYIPGYDETYYGWRPKGSYVSQGSSGKVYSDQFEVYLGKYEWQVQARDEEGVISNWSNSWFFTVNSSTPLQGACTISGPSLAYTNESLTFLVDKSCNFGSLSEGQWYVDNQIVPGATGTSFTTSFSTPGNHSISYKFNCNSQNQTEEVWCHTTVTIKERWRYFWRELAP